MAKQPRSGHTAIVSAPALDERKYQLELEKHARERLSREDARVGQALTWLLACQTLLGGSYAYLKQQIIDSMQRNWETPWLKLTRLAADFPLIPIALCCVFLCSVAAASRAEREIRRSYPQFFGSEPRLLRTGPLAAAAVGLLFTVGWLIVLVALP